MGGGGCILIFSRSARRISFEISCHYSWFQKKFVGQNANTWICTLPINALVTALRVLLERGLPYTLKSPNEKLMHTLVHFVISLQSRFYSWASISMSYVDIYYSSLRLFKIDLVVSHPPTIHRQYFILVLSLPLLWLRVTFALNALIALQKLFFRPLTAKRLSIKVFVIL